MTPGRPRGIVLVLVDDMGFSDIGCYGSEISTPQRRPSRGRRRAFFTDAQLGEVVSDTRVLPWEQVLDLIRTIRPAAG